MNKEKSFKGEVNIKDRAALTVSGVSSVTSFDSEYVALDTDSGAMTVEGEELKIESLDKESGEIEIKGRINGLYYNDRKQREGFLSRLFK